VRVVQVLIQRLRLISLILTLGVLGLGLVVGDELLRRLRWLLWLLLLLLRLSRVLIVLGQRVLLVLVLMLLLLLLRRLVGVLAVLHELLRRGRGRARTVVNLAVLLLHVGVLQRLKFKIGLGVG
jgi:hypothetical protein